MKNDERVRNLNMTEFYIETLPDVFIVYCEYHRNVSKSAECMRSILGHFRVNWKLGTIQRRPCGAHDDWEFRLTFNGYCLEYNNDTAEYDNGTAKKPSKVRSKMLSFLIYVSPFRKYQFKGRQVLELCLLIIDPIGLMVGWLLLMASPFFILRLS